ncbi:MAG: tetratricopeptide repeat protein [Chloroflexi bacterium]|nr:MAG: tetratricopeptide repeat protein [Chloroflexota bacterium]
MSSRLQLLCDAVMEATWLAALITAPLFFNVYSQRVFEPDKISIVRSLALVALVAWAVKKLDGLRLAGNESQGREAEDGGGADSVPLWRKPLATPVLVLALVYLLSTLASVAPGLSFWGSYQRLQGTFTTYSYMVLFFVLLDTLQTKAQWRRLQYTIILTSLPIALYGVLQHYKLDSLPWGGDTTTRVAGNMGNPIFIAAYLIMALPLTVERLIAASQRMLLDEEGSTADALAAGALLFVLIVQVVSIIFTQSRGPWLGLAAGGYVFLLLGLTSLRQRAGRQDPLSLAEVGSGIGMGLAGVALVGLGLLAMFRISGLVGLLVLGLTALGALALYLVPILTRRGWRWLWLSVLAQAVVIGLLLVVINLPNSPLQSFKDLPYVGRMARVMETESGTGKVRVLIWKGVIQMIQPHEPLEYPDGHKDALNILRPLIGYGPEAMWITYPRFYQPELGGLEARNASPDRSHNETFDSLVITGAIGFLAYIFLFSSVFYYALKWLGLMRGARDRTLFVALGVAGGAVGVLLPVLVGSPHFAGVGVALGFIVGVILYITWAAYRGSEGIEKLGRRQLILVAILATVVAHFVEIHFGIAIVATRTYFYALIAALVTVGMGQVNLEEEKREEVPVQPAAAPSRRRRKRSKRSQAQPAIRQTTPALWRTLLPYVAVSVLIIFVIDWDYISNQEALRSTLAIFWRSWTSHLQEDHLVAGPGPLWLVLFTLVVGVVLAFGETWQSRHRLSDILAGTGVYLGTTLIVWVVFGLLMAARLLPLPQTMPIEQRAAQVANHISFFYGWLAVFLLLLAMTLYVDDGRRVKTWSLQPALATGGGAVFLGVALYVIVSVNINLVRADIYFKLGQSTDARGDWRTSLIFYDKAAELAPSVDHYQLFRGRALLESARSEQDANRRAALLDQAEEVLYHARELNPLNTDHSSNLARYYATRAATLSDPAEREQALRKSAEQYAIATSLSPNTAHLQNEWGTVYVELGEYDKARERFMHSLELDPKYNDTYLRLAQLETRLENWEAALEAYTRAAELRPKDIRAHSGRGYVLAQLGRTEEAIQANLDALAINPNDISTLQNLAILNQQVGRYKEALTYAERARDLLPEDQRANIEALITQLRQQIGSG